MIAALARKLGYAPTSQTARARLKALTEIFGRSDLDLFRLSRVQLRRILRHLLARDLDFCPPSITVAIAMDYVGHRRFQAGEPGLERELSLRTTVEIGGFVPLEDRPEIERRSTAQKLRQSTSGGIAC